MSTVDWAPSQTLRQAGRWIGEHGHVKGAFTDSDNSGAACVRGAICRVLSGHFVPRPVQPSWGQQSIALDVFAEYLNGGRVTATPMAVVGRWNDATARTAHEVEQALYDAAAWAQQREQGVAW